MSSDLRDVLAAGEPITRTIGGRVYGFPRTIEARFGILLADGMNDTKEAFEYISEDEQFDIRDVLMGPARRDMIRDGVTTEELDVVFSYLTLYHVLSAEAAEAYWDGLGKPQTPRDVEPSTTTGAATETPTPASTSGTSTPPKKPRKKAPASRSRGR